MQPELNNITIQMEFAHYSHQRIGGKFVASYYFHTRYSGKNCLTKHINVATILRPFYSDTEEEELSGFSCPDDDDQCM